MNTKIKNTKVAIITFLFVNILLILQNAEARFANDETKTLIERGDKYLLYSRFDSALTQFTEAKAIAENTQDWIVYIDCLNKISETYSSAYDPEKAQNIALEALKLANEKAGKNSIQAVAALNNLGNAHYLRGRHQAALEEFNKVMEMYDLLPEDKKYVLSAPVIMGIGNVYYSKYQYRDALKHFKDALDINTKHYGAEHPNVAYSYMSLGNLYRNMGSFSNAQDNFDKASTLLVKYFGENHPSVATSYIGKADLYCNTRQYDLAIQYYLKAQSIYEQFLKPSDPRFGDIFMGLGDINKGQREYELAIENYKKALNIFVGSVGKEHQNSVRANLEIGNSFMYEEKNTEALKYYNNVLEINYMLVGENHTNTSGAYNNLGGVYYFIGNYNVALNYYEKALKIDKAIYGNDHPNVANSYYNIARVYAEKGNSEQALNYIQLAINSSIINFDDKDIYTNPKLLNYFDDKDLMWYLNFKGETLEAGFKTNANVKGLDVALHSFVLSDSLIDKIRESYTNKIDQAELAKITTKIYASAVNAAYSLINLITPQNVKFIDRDATYEQKLKEYKDKLFYFSEKSKACMLFSSVAKANAKNFGGVPDSLLQKEVKLKSNISQLTQELYMYTDPEIKKQVAQKLFESNRSYESLLASFSKDFPKYHDLKYDVGVVSVAQLQKFLPDTSMLISYLISKDNLYIISVSKTNIDIIKKPYDGSLERWVRAFRNGILLRIDEVYYANAYDIYNYLIPPNIPNTIKNIIIVPDGPIHFVPFEALLDKNANETSTYKNLPFLVNKYAFSYTYAANLVYRIFNNPKTAKPKAPLDGYALAPINFKYQSTDTLNNQIINYPSLVGTESEIVALNAIFSVTGKSFIYDMYKDASETKLNEMTPGNFQYLHLATHGFTSDANPDQSGILLHQNNRKEDGMLLAGEIYNINLNAEMVVLSACETGLGKTSFGEGLVGMGRSLLYAGAKNLTLSLWTVSDEATNTLMAKFYSYIIPLNVPSAVDKSLSYAAYLRKAKLDLVHSDNFSHPYYWAPFILQGK
ncbi:MAG: CHAT domain-containing protein [Cytophagales bacterium]